MYSKKKKKGKKNTSKINKLFCFFERFREVLGHSSKRKKEFGNLIGYVFFIYLFIYLFIALKVLKFDLGGLSLAMNFFQ